MSTPLKLFSRTRRREELYRFQCYHGNGVHPSPRSGITLLNAIVISSRNQWCPLCSRGASLKPITHWKRCILLLEAHLPPLANLGNAHWKRCMLQLDSLQNVIGLKGRCRCCVPHGIMQKETCQNCTFLLGLPISYRQLIQNKSCHLLRNRISSLAHLTWLR